MKKHIELEQSDIDSLHDVILEALNLPDDIPNDVVIGIWYSLPEYLKDEAVHWGIYDSVVRDNIYE